MTELEQLAADLRACEYFLQHSRDPAGIAAAKWWLAELEAFSLLLSGRLDYRRGSMPPN